MTEVCKVLEFPDDVDRLLDKLNYEQRTDWELVNNLQVVYGKWSKVPLRMFYIKGDQEVEVYYNKDFKIEDEYEIRDEVFNLMEKLGFDGEVVK